MGGVHRWWLVVVCVGEDDFECVKWLCGMQR